MRRTIADLIREGNNIKMTKMYPIMWMLLFVMIFTTILLLGGVERWVAVVLLGYLGLFSLVALALYVYAFVWKPDRLETEGYRRKKKQKDNTRP